MTDLFHPDAEPGQPYWWQGVSWPELNSTHPDTCDLLVIGGGYTGLSAAIAAHDAGAAVVLVEAGIPGQGASSRNGGMVGAHPRLAWDVLEKTFGAEVADALFAEGEVALDWLRALIAREGIACDWQDCGRVQLAYTKAQFERQKSLARDVREKSGTPCEVLSRDAVKDEITTTLYHGGILFPQHAAVHPAKLLQGMLQAVLRRDIPVATQCRVTALERERPGYRATTRFGTIHAKQVVLATNGYTTHPFRWFVRRVFALPSYMIATEPLSPSLITMLAPGRRTMVETRAQHNYYRISPDGSCLLFGGRAAMVPVALTLAARRLRAAMAEIWPQLSQVRLSHVWSGNTGYSFTHMPYVGVQDGIHFALGYSGGGTVLAPWLGAKAALLALDDPRGQTAYSHTRLTRRWFHPVAKPYFLQGANFWYKIVVDPREDREACK